MYVHRGHDDDDDDGATAMFMTAVGESPLLDYRTRGMILNHLYYITILVNRLSLLNGREERSWRPFKEARATIILLSRLLLLV